MILPSSLRFQIYGILQIYQAEYAFDIVITVFPPAGNPQIEIQFCRCGKRLPSVRNIHLSALSRARRTAFRGFGFRRHSNFGENQPDVQISVIQLQRSDLPPTVGGSADCPTVLFQYAV